MGHISGEDRSQLLLLPDTVDDYVGPDNPVRFIDAFVDSLDLEEPGFQRVRPNDKGRPGYDPADLLKLYIYGYLTRVRSSRRLEVETYRNLEVICCCASFAPTSRRSPTSAATTGAPSGRSFGSSCGYAENLTCTGAS